MADVGPGTGSASAKSLLETMSARSGPCVCLPSWHRPPQAMHGQGARALARLSARDGACGDRDRAPWPNSASMPARSTCFCAILDRAEQAFRSARPHGSSDGSTRVPCPSSQRAWARLSWHASWPPKLSRWQASVRICRRHDVVAEILWRASRQARPRWHPEAVSYATETLAIARSTEFLHLRPSLPRRAAAFLATGRDRGGARRRSGGGASVRGQVTSYQQPELCTSPRSTVRGAAPKR